MISSSAPFSTTRQVKFSPNSSRHQNHDSHPIAAGSVTPTDNMVNWIPLSADPLQNCGSSARRWHWFFWEGGGGIIINPRWKLTPILFLDYRGNWNSLLETNTCLLTCLILTYHHHHCPLPSSRPWQMIFPGPTSSSDMTPQLCFSSVEGTPKWV